MFMATCVSWDSQFNTGNQIIDFQNRKLFEKIDNCVHAARNDTPRAHLISMLEDIWRCVKVHFALEEELLKESGLCFNPHISQHKSRLRSFKRDIDRLKRDNDFETHAIQDVLFSLHDWCIDHFERADALHFGR